VPLTEPDLPPLTDGEFAARLDRLGPFEPAPHLAAAVSGGADSTALAVLASGWAASRGGRLTALIVDHGLRPESTREAALTATRLAARGVPARILELADLRRGPGLAERARQARHAALAQACAEAGILHLLLGHHAGDQAETVAMRAGSGSAARGLAAMAALTERPCVRLLRPLLDVPPGRLRATLRKRGMDWVEDPSNRDPATLRARLRQHFADPGGGGPEVTAAVARAQEYGAAREAADRRLAAELAARVRFYPFGHAVLSPGPVGELALAALLRAVSGRPYAPASGGVAALAARPRAATLGGVRLRPAGRLGAGWLVVREEAAMAAPVAAGSGAVWDGRFRLCCEAGALPPGVRLGALGKAASRFRDRRGPPASVLATLPALWLHADLFAVPHLDYPDRHVRARLQLLHIPATPAGGGSFVPSTISE
jgi:tRNA(Ile)-lysidine synthase